jgi:hypothetical protein
MPTFVVYAKNGTTDRAVKVEFHLGGKFRGYTSDRANDPLMVEISQRGTYNWYARRGGEVIQRGSSSGGNIVIIV